MSMPIEKAKGILEAYKSKKYNAGQALKSVGYSWNNARANSGRTIDTAVKTLVRANEKDAILEFLGMTSKDISKEYKKVIEQDKNYPAKLRALEPLLKKQGIEWDSEKATTTVPILNLTVSDNTATAQQSHADEHVAQHVLCDTDSVAINKDTIANEPSPPAP